MRLLLAAEGESDEIVASAIVRQYFPSASIDCKSFPSRGWPIVRRLTPTTVKAAHFGFYDILVVHFDSDDGRTDGDGSRKDRLLQAVSDTLNTLPHANRQIALRTVLCAATQSIDAWLMWGIQDGDGRSWERMPRHQLKTAIYGDPPRQLRAKAAEVVPQLLSRMESSENWPVALREFVNTIIQARNSIATAGREA